MSADRLVRDLLLPVVQLVLWMFLYLSILLGGWVLLGLTVGGWSPVVVTSGSMEPTLSAGDVLLIETEPGESVTQRSIVVFERDNGDVIAHRVLAVEPDGYVTKGDANPGPDSERIQDEDIIGAGRLVVPLVGMPAVWVQRGNVLALSAWLVISVAAAFHLLVVAAGSARSPRSRRSSNADMPIAQQGIRRVRTLVAVLIVAQYAFDPTRFDVVDLHADRRWVLLASVMILLGTNAASARLADRKMPKAVLPVAELAVDTTLVVVLATMTGTSGIGWVLFALPIIEAAIRFRLVGALTHWMVLTAVTIASRIWVDHLSPSGNLLEELEMVLDQLSVLFLVVVPGAYLAEQLIGDVASQQRATGRALDRGELLELVAETGREATRLGGEHVASITAGARRLGFDVVDVVIRTERSGWSHVEGGAGDGLPLPGEAGSGLRRQDLAHRSLIVDHLDPDVAEVRALDAVDLEALVVQTVSEQDRSRVVLRAGMRSGTPISPAQLDAFRLLAGQASVALHNDELLSEITSMHGELEHQAHHDGLTRLPNRALLLKKLTTALSGDDVRPALIFLDLDGFKSVNDRLGHEVGDNLLRQVSARLLNVVPENSLVARVGGDEFTVLVPGLVTEEQTADIARAIWDRIREPFQMGRDLVRVSTSLGIAFGEAGMSETELIRRADVAMYQVKQRPGDDVYEIYRPALDLAGERRGRLVAGFGRALQNDQITLAYQPIYQVADAQVLSGVEALVRWRHPDYGDIPPGEIIEIARAANGQDLLNKWIVRRACEDTTGWLAGRSDIPFFVTVNASPEELASPELVTNVTDALVCTGLDPRRLFVEISERLVSPDAPDVVNNMKALQDTNVRMLLDDFGEGQTSLSYIHELPVAGIKLDRKLVVNALRSETDRIVLESVTDLCHRLGLVVIAEGIETSGHMDVISTAGCNLAQGYYLGRPQLGCEIAPLVDGLRRQSSLPAAKGV